MSTLLVSGLFLFLFACMLLILDNRYVIYFYLLCIPVLKIGPYVLGYENPDLGLFYMGTPDSGVGINFILVGLFICYAFFYLFHLSQRHKLPFCFREYIGNPGAKYLLLMTLFILISLFFQTFYNHLPITWVIRKGRDDVTYLLLTFLVFSLFYKKNECWRLLQFSLFIFVIVAFASVFFGHCKELMRGGVYFQRIEMLSMSAGPGSIYLGMHIPFCLFFFKWSKGVKKWLWIAIALFAAIIGFMTITRSYIIALFIAVIVWGYIQKSMKKKLILLLLLLGIMLLTYSFLEILFVSDISYQQNTLYYRIERGWLPSIQAVLSDPIHFFFGFYARSFTAWTHNFLGYNHAAHNITLGYMIKYGVPVASMWLLMYGSIFWQGIRLAKRSRKSRERDLLIACILSLLIHFVGAHSCNVGGIQFLTPVFTYMPILWLAMRQLKSRNRGLNNEHRHLIPNLK